VRLDGQDVIGRRTADNLTQDGLARKAGLSKRTIETAEAGEPVSRATLAALARYFKCEPNELLLSEAPHDNLASRGLSQYETSFDALIEDRTRGFRGRSFVFDEIDRFVNDPGVPSGYFVIRGAPGIGKSAVIAKLVKRRSLPVFHFNIALQRINTARHFLGNICARIIRHFGLDCGELQPGFDGDGTVLNRLLHEAAECLKCGEKLLIAVDALDEVDSVGHPGANPLFLPFDLPTGVYFVLTTRLKDSVALQGAHVRDWTLDWNSDDNKADVRAFVQDHLQREGVHRWALEHGLTDQEFVEEMGKKSEGNFMYLRHVLPAIEQGRFVKGGVRELPQGLHAYYRCHWNQMHTTDLGTFERLHVPVVCGLGAAQEAVPPELLVEWTQLELHEVVGVLREWREFLHAEPGADGQLNYRLYHTAFREFLQEEVDPGLKRYHRMILEACKKKIDPLLDSDE
jgi:transcriptional regulator with XRE-family HTH domain